MTYIRTEEHRKKMSDAVPKREKHYKWTGGIRGELAPAYKVRRLEAKAGRKKPQECEVCGGGGKICFDHDHAKGVFRGWLCDRCNKVLGFVKDNSELLIALAKYLKASGGDETKFWESLP